MSEHTIQAQARTELGRKTNRLRADGKIPAVVYGFEIKPMSISVDRVQMDKLYEEAGESTLLTLHVDGKEHEVLIEDVQRDPMTGFLRHADFRKIDLNKPVEATVELKLVGESGAVKELGGTLVQSLDEVEVSALPKALVREIDVDISALKTFDDMIRVSDLKVPAGIEILTTPTFSVAMVQPPRSEAELAALDEAVVENVEAVEVTTEKKVEEGEEGAAGDKKPEAKKPEQKKK